MFKSHLKTAWRNIIRHRTYSLINVFGLGLGISACLVIYVIATYEFSFDNFHRDKEQIYRVVGRVRSKDGRTEWLSNMPPPASSVIGKEIAGIENAAGFQFYNAKVTIPGNGSRSGAFDTKWEIVVADDQFFHIFEHQWLAGNSASSLNKPFSVVLSEKKARKYFGDIPYDEMIGRWVVYDDSLKVSVSGIVKDWDRNSDFAFADFISVSTAKSSFLKTALSLDSWSDDVPHTSMIFVKLEKGVRAGQVAAQLPLFCKKHMIQEPGSNFSMQLQPLSDVHFNANYLEYPFRKAYKPILYGLMGVALFILVIAAFNFINLSTAQSIQRVKEIGVRKVLGSSRIRLMILHLSETLLITFLALIVSLGMLKPVTAVFRSFIPDDASLNFFDASTLSFLLLLIFGTCLLAGLYPARVISAYLPLQSLRKAGNSFGRRGVLFRRILIVFQFAISLVFIIGTMIVDRQLLFMQSKELGFSTNSILTIDTDKGDNIAKVSLLADKIRNLAGVEKVALQSFTPMSDMALNVPVRRLAADTKRIPAMLQSASRDFLPLYQIKLLAGRNPEHSDTLNEVVINKELSIQLGYKEPRDAVGKSLYLGRSMRPLTIAGVTVNFHEHAFQETIRPLLIADIGDQETGIAVKLQSEGKNLTRVRAVLSGIEKEWKAVYPAEPLRYNFFDEAIALLYKRERDIARLMNAATLVTLFISCIGLFGLAMFAGEQRTKEIGIRKVMGATVRDIVLMLSRDFIVLILLAFVIAVPIAWFSFHTWLQEFAYRVTIGWWVFVSAGLGTLLMAMITVSFQAIKAAIVNPVTSLRTE